ncbi:B-cell receptor CD22-like [Myxocyprinus asiaticus]|uniref:B-cell receptor CD22-like n=1 Tax=Myxocyprinus asiaticus TaxID=70543 RepID=UPI002221BC3A|nr:B-cell receptor CD22-like [Myxocyprinus asiaticus]
MFHLFSLIFLLVIPGICGQTWNVKYTNLNICALKGSTTLLSGSYTHPNGLTVTKTFWTTNPVSEKENTDLSDNPHYKDRIEYFLNKDQIFFLKLSNVTDLDESMYCIKILTNVKDQRWLGYPCIDLKVTDLRVEIPEEVREGNSAVLVCKTTCNLGNRANYNWYKNSKPFSGSLSTNELLLQSVSSDDTGNYSCAVTQHEHLPSPAVTLSVRYPPKNVLVSMSGSGEIVLGDSVTLTCSSDSNPPAHIYTWFKENETSSVGSGQSYSISNFNSSHSGQFYCVAQNQHGSERSAAVSITSKAGQNKALYAVAGIVAVLVCICIVIVVTKVISRQRRDTGVRGGISKQDNISVAVTDQSMHTTVCDSPTANQNDLIYTSITHQRPKVSRQDQMAGDNEEVQYATVHHHKNTENKGVEAPSEYGNIRNHSSAVSSRFDSLTRLSSCCFYHSSFGLWQRDSLQHEVAMVTFIRIYLPLILLVMTAGVDGQQYWGVNYSPSYVCALRGSSVKMFCTFTFPSGYEVKTVFWTKSVVSVGEPPDLCSDPEYRGRVQCLSENKDTFSITLRNVTEADKHIYYCRFTSNRGDVKWTGIPGVQLDVTDLQVETQQRVREGDSVTLTCKSTCTLTEETTFIWYINKQTVTKGTVTVNQLHLHSVSSDDTQYYSCAVRGNEHLRSPAVYLQVGLVSELWGVNYNPSHVCALRGSSVKISCTIKYPSGYEVKRVFWTKTAFVSGAEPPDLCSDPEYRGRIQCLNENKDTYSITLTDVTQADKRIYYFRFTTNREDGKRTGIPAARLNVTDLQVETPQSVKERDSVTLTCKITCTLTEKTTFIWYKNTQTVTKGTVTVNQLHLQSVTRHDAGNYRCAVTGNELLSSPDVYLDVTYPPENVSVSISGSGEIVLGDSVTLTCSSDSNPPVLNYTWFKENESSAVGSGQSYSALQSGFFYCVAQNQHGSERSAALSVSVTGVQTAALYTVSGIVAGCGGLFLIIVIIIIIIILFMRKKRRDGGAEVMRQNQENRSSAGADPTNDLPISPQLSTNQSDGLYACIAHKKPNSSRNAQTAAGDVDSVQYASVQYLKNKEKKKTEDKDINFEMSHSSDPSSSVDVIYSSVK